jgi:hypothetical protein
MKHSTHCLRGLSQQLATPLSKLDLGSSLQRSPISSRQNIFQAFRGKVFFQAFQGLIFSQAFQGFIFFQAFEGKIFFQAFQDKICFQACEGKNSL